MDPIQAVTIAEGRCRDAFAVLGPHEEGGQFSIRAWLPHVRAATVLVGANTIEMSEGPAKGLFTASLTARPNAYELRITLYSGEVLLVEDPYRFPPLLTSFELHLHGEGTHYESYRTLGSHLAVCEGVEGGRFAVWAPNAEVVSVMGGFNGWDRTRHPMRLRDGGIWEMFIPGIGLGEHYKYSVVGRDSVAREKCDPYAFFAEVPPKTASIVWPLTNHA